MSVIATATNTVTTITDPSFNEAAGVAVPPDGSKGLCRELFRQHGVGDRYRDQYAGLNGAATLQHTLDHASE
jgi:hypothetical protein